MGEAEVVGVDRPGVRAEIRESYWTDNTNPFKDPALCKVLVGEPSLGIVDSIIYDNRKDFWCELKRLETHSNLRFFNAATQRLMVTYARECLAEYAIDQGMDYLFMVDDDMMVPKNLFAHLLTTALKTGADITAPICTTRHHPYRPVMYRLQEVEVDGQKRKHSTYVEEYEPQSVIDDLDAVGVGVVLIKTELLKKMQKPLFFTNTNVGEDIGFCWRAKFDHGAKIVVDTRLKIGHMGMPKWVTEKDYVEATKKGDKFKAVYPDLGRELQDIERLNEIREVRVGAQ